MKGLVTVAVFALLVICVAIIAHAVNKRASIRAKTADTVDGEELRKLAEMAVTTQEHNDLVLRDITLQIGQLREQMDAIQQILKQVE